MIAYMKDGGAGELYNSWNSLYEPLDEPIVPTATVSAATAQAAPQDIQSLYQGVASGETTLAPDQFDTLFSSEDRAMSAGEFALLSPETQTWARANPQQFMQSILANRNPANQDLASVGAEGGYSDLSKIAVSPTGLDYSQAGYMEVNDEDLLEEIAPVLLIAATIYFGGVGAGLWGTAEGAAAAGIAEAGAGAALGAGEAVSGFYGATAGELAGAAASYGGVTAGAIEAAAGIPELGLIATPETGAGLIEATMGAPELGLAEQTMGLPAEAAPTPNPYTASQPLDVLPPDPVPAPPANPYTASQPLDVVPPADPVSLVDKAIEWATKQIVTEALKSAIAPEAIAPVAPAKTPFGFFGGLPWKSKAASGAPGLNRLSTGKSVFGAGALASPGGIVSNWMGRG